MGGFADGFKEWCEGMVAEKAAKGRAVAERKANQKIVNGFNKMLEHIDDPFDEADEAAFAFNQYLDSLR